MHVTVVTLTPKAEMEFTRYFLFLELMIDLKYIVTWRRMVEGGQ